MRETASLPRPEVCDVVGDGLVLVAGGLAPRLEIDAASRCPERTGRWGGAGCSPYAAFSSLPSTIAIDFDPGANVHSVVSRITSAEPDGTPGGTYEVHRVLGAAVANAGQMSGQPLTLAIVFAAVTLVSLSAIVVTSARRRRRELAVFRTLGLTRNQVRAVLGWHSATILVIAGVIGLPLGITAGRWLWSSFATSLGAVPTTEIPGVALALGVGGLVVVGTVLTALPAVVLSKNAPGTALRTA